VPLLLICILTGCSTSSTKRSSSTTMPDVQKDAIQLKVRTGNPLLDRFVYEEAYALFGETIPLRETGEITATMEVLFTGQEQGTFIGSTTVNASSHTTVTADSRSYIDGWYTSSAFGATVHGTTVVKADTSGQAQAVTTGGVLAWMNGNMLVVIKRNDGKRLWNGNYRYKGGWEMSGWTVKTPDEAASLMLKRLHRKLKSDFRE